MISNPACVCAHTTQRGVDRRRQSSMKPALTHWSLSQDFLCSPPLEYCLLTTQLLSVRNNSTIRSFSHFCYVYNQTLHPSNDNVLNSSHCRGAFVALSHIQFCLWAVFPFLDRSAESTPTIHWILLSLSWSGAAK